MNRKNIVMDRLRALDGLRKAEATLSRELDLSPSYVCDGRKYRALKRELRRVQCRIETVENALQVLDPEERLVADWLFIYPRKGNVQRLCQTLAVEQSTVYRKRERMLKKMVKAMFGG